MESEALEKIRTDETSDAIYHGLLVRLDALGEYQIEPKKTSLHVTHGRAFLGIHPRKGALLLNIVSREALTADRIRKAERLSARRFHNEVLLSSPEEVDAELMGWVAEAYAMTS